MSKSHNSLDFFPKKSRNQTCNTMIYVCNIRITIRMLHTVTKQLEICIDVKY